MRVIKNSRRYFFECLPAPARLQAFENAKAGTDFNEVVESFNQALSGAFDYASTEQGKAYWDNIAQLSIANI
jgi:hypothetical protein